MPSIKNTPPHSLVSVIIPCYNQAHYLHDSINSVLTQTYAPIEIIVVDDGSSDNTKEVVATYPTVKYVYKKNGGLSSARNCGIDNSTGDFLLFLDSDDWLLPGAVSTNMNYLHSNPEAAYVSGSHKKIRDGVILPEEERVQISLPPYHQLLHQNYIGMIAAVLFRRWIFDKHRYDESLKSCEDYDLYLQITRDHLAINHTEDLSRYRIHGNSISGNLNLMLRDVTTVLMRQEERLRNEQEKSYLQAGLNNWKKYFFRQYYIQQKEALSKGRSVDFKTFPGQSSLYLKYLKTLLRLQHIVSRPGKA
jgi:glycosyltransferase involved in cell wall biosynthesis